MGSPTLVGMAPFGSCLATWGEWEADVDRLEKTADMYCMFHILFILALLVDQAQKQKYPKLAFKSCSRLYFLYETIESELQALVAIKRV